VRLSALAPRLADCCRIHRQFVRFSGNPRPSANAIERRCASLPDPYLGSYRRTIRQSDVLARGLDPQDEGSVDPASLAVPLRIHARATPIRRRVLHDVGRGTAASHGRREKSRLPTRQIDPNEGKWRSRLHDDRASRRTLPQRLRAALKGLEPDEVVRICVACPDFLSRFVAFGLLMRGYVRARRRVERSRRATCLTSMVSVSADRVRVPRPPPTSALRFMRL
jgi:hypothetical protein